MTKLPWRKGALTNAEIVLALLEVYRKEGSETCSCGACKLGRKVIRQRRWQDKGYTPRRTR